jgi:hypothetical protein
MKIKKKRIGRDNNDNTNANRTIIRVQYEYK